jgi:dipeptidyl aminopeptidase/acylaminoacyl peptidase
MTETTPGPAAPTPEKKEPRRIVYARPPGLLAPPKKKRFGFLVVPLEILTFLVAATSFVLAVGTYQAVRPARQVTSETPRDLRLAYEDVKLKTADGVDVAAWYVPAKDGGKDAILVLHGYPTDKGDILPRASFLADKYSLLLLDFRYFGASGGRYTTVGLKETAEALAGIDYLKKRGAERVGIYGFSMGAAVALETLDHSSDVAAVAAETPYADLRSVAAEPYRYLGPLKGTFAELTMLVARALTGVDPDASSPRAAASRTKVPVLLMHAKDDPVVSFSNAEAIAAALKDDPGAETWFPAQGGHGEPSSDFAKTVLSFFDRTLH